jgi:hypothetical protein
MKTLTLLPQKDYMVDKKLTIRVETILEKWYEGRLSVMVVTIKLKTFLRRDSIVLTSESRKALWGNYELQYVGGWRDEVELNIIDKTKKTLNNEQ